MKQKIITGTIILITTILLFVVITGSKNKKTQKLENNLTDSSNVVVISTDTDIFYWGETCPHCHDTIDWMEENIIDGKLKVIRKEISKNDNNAKELIQNAKICGINEKEVGIPFMFTKTQKCLVGTPDITSYLREELNKLEVNKRLIINKNEKNN